jgi:hypothetical protein
MIVLKRVGRDGTGHVFILGVTVDQVAHTLSTGRPRVVDARDVDDTVFILEVGEDLQDLRRRIGRRLPAEEAAMFTATIDRREAMDRDGNRDSIAINFDTPDPEKEDPQ